MKPLIYVAHPFGGEKHLLDKAERWVAKLSLHFDAIFWAPWIPLCRNWPDSGESRARGLEIDMAAVDRSDGVILVGGYVSPGMTMERDRASSVLDMVHLCDPVDLCCDQCTDWQTIEMWIGRLERGRSQ